MNPDRPLNEQGIGCDEAAIRIICAARREPIPIGRDEAHGTCQVGGFVQLAHVDRGTAWTSIVHRWPDVVGVRLDPLAGSLLPDALCLPEPEAAPQP